MLSKNKSVLGALALSTVAISPCLYAGASANAGFVSDYYFRGVNLGDGGLYAGLDYEAGGFYAGTWWIDDGHGGNDGLETDGYLGYGMEHGDFSWSVGYNRYDYTYTSDYEDEVAVSLGFAMVSLDIVDGTAYDETSSPTSESDYEHVALGVSGDVLGVTVGSTEFDDDPFGSYDYIEFSAGGEIGGFDVSVTAGDASYDGGDPGAYMFLDIGKSFDL